MWKRLSLLPIACALLAAAACTPSTSVTVPAAAPAKPIAVLIQTSLGDIQAEVYPDKAPVTVKNFLGYVDDKFYDGTLFHRVIPTFMIQGGGYVTGMKEKLGKPPITCESDNGLANERGTLAMARETAPDTATSEFYINVVDNAKLDRANAKDKVGYCVFGKVTRGMDVVDKIKAVKTATKGENDDVPVEEVVIQSIRRVP